MILLLESSVLANFPVIIASWSNGQGIAHLFNRIYRLVVVDEPIYHRPLLEKIPIAFFQEYLWSPARGSASGFHFLGSSPPQILLLPCAIYIIGLDIFPVHVQARKGSSLSFLNWTALSLKARSYFLRVFIILQN